MSARTPFHQIAYCDATDDYVRGEIGPGEPGEVHDCYRALAIESLIQGIKRLMIVALADAGGITQAAVCNAVTALVIAQVPTDFHLALVSRSAQSAKANDAGVIEALRHGIEARQFSDEAEAVQWLQS